MTRRPLRFNIINPGILLVMLLCSLHFFSVSHAATIVPLTEYGNFPMSVIGTLTHRNPSGTYQRCTGTALISRNESIVDTAAHCFYNNQGVLAAATNMLFCPQYQHGNAPHGCWVGRKLFIAHNYNFADNTNIGAINDYGFLVVSPNNNNETLVRAIGGTTAKINDFLSTMGTTTTAYGYPSTSPYKGNMMYSFTGSPVYTTTQSGSYLYLTQFDMFNGASGGPWLTTLSDNRIYLIGHSSRYSPSKEEFSPVLDQAWNNLFNMAQNA